MVQPFAKNPKAKKICLFFFQITRSLPRFYFVIKKNKNQQQKQKFFGGIPQLRSYRLTSVLRALKSTFIFPEMWLCASLFLFLILHKREQNNKVQVECLLFFHATDALYSHWCRWEPQLHPLIFSLLSQAQQDSVDDFVDCGLLVSGTCDDELVIRRDITAEDRRRLLRLEYAGSVRRPPCIE